MFFRRKRIGGLRQRSLVLRGIIRTAEDTEKNKKNRKCSQFHPFPFTKAIESRLPTRGQWQSHLRASRFVFLGRAVINARRAAFTDSESAKTFDTSGSRSTTVRSFEMRRANLLGLAFE